MYPQRAPFNALSPALVASPNGRCPNWGLLRCVGSLESLLLHRAWHELLQAGEATRPQVVTFHLSQNSLIFKKDIICGRCQTSRRDARFTNLGDALCQWRGCIGCMGQGVPRAQLVMSGKTYQKKDTRCVL